MIAGLGLGRAAGVDLGGLAGWVEAEVLGPGRVWGWVRSGTGILRSCSNRAR
ncbi:MAG: hypothetical protein AB1641_01125 [Thermodesulfobacteriota bacterium]